MNGNIIFFLLSLQQSYKKYLQGEVDKGRMSTKMFTAKLRKSNENVERIKNEMLWLQSK